jgi:hypothetical protein
VVPGIDTVDVTNIDMTLLAGRQGHAGAIFRGRMAMLGLYVPTLASWYSALRSELLGFPAGKYDDQVDALGLIGQLLDRITAGQRPITPRVEKPNPYRPMYEEFQECSIKLL